MPATLAPDRASDFPTRPASGESRPVEAQGSHPARDGDVTCSARRRNEPAPGVEGPAGPCAGPRTRRWRSEYQALRTLLCSWAGSARGGPAGAALALPAGAGWHVGTLGGGGGSSVTTAFNLCLRGGSKVSSGNCRRLRLHGGGSPAAHVRRRPAPRNATCVCSSVIHTEHMLMACARDSLALREGHTSIVLENAQASSVFKGHASMSAHSCSSSARPSGTHSALGLNFLVISQCEQTAHGSAGFSTRPASQMWRQLQPRP